VASDCLEGRGEDARTIEIVGEGAA